MILVAFVAGMAVGVGLTALLLSGNDSARPPW